MSDYCFNGVFLYSNLYKSCKLKMFQLSMSNRAYFIALIISSTVLLTLLIVMLQQLCFIEWDNKSKTLYVIGLALFAILLNSLVYLSSMYPNYQLIFSKITILKLRVLIEAITIIYGSMVYHKWFIIFLKHISPTNLPQIYQKVIILTPILISILTLIFYSFALFDFHHQLWDWMRYFYIIFACIICIEAFGVLFFFNKILKLLNDMNINESPTKKTIRIAMTINIMLIIASFGSIFLNFDFIFDIIMKTNKTLVFDFTLLSNLSMSGFIITFTIGLTYWIFQECLCQCCIKYIFCLNHKKSNKKNPKFRHLQKENCNVTISSDYAQYINKGSISGN